MTPRKKKLEDADALVLFGATGDLAKKKLYPALYNMALSGFLATDIVGVASTKWNHEEFVNYAFDSIKSVVKAPDDKVLAFLDKHLDLVVGKYQEQTLYDDLAKRLEGKHNIVIYLAIPPSAFEQVTRGLHAAGLMGRVRLVVE